MALSLQVLSSYLGLLWENGSIGQKDFLVRKAIYKILNLTKFISAAKTFLIIQNTCVSLCAVLLSWFIVYKSEHPEISDWWVLLVSVIAIILASVARLASSGVNIIIQKDWIVIIADHDNDKLAKMNSILRTIELTTYMLGMLKMH